LSNRGLDGNDVNDGNDGNDGNDDIDDIEEVEKDARRDAPVSINGAIVELERCVCSCKCRGEDN
jgi:hypothetical protein